MGTKIWKVPDQPETGCVCGSLRAVRHDLPYLAFQVSSTLGYLLTVVFHLQENLSFFFGPLHFKIQFGLLLDSNHLPQKFKVSTLTLRAICCLLPTGGFILLFVPLHVKMQLHPFWSLDSKQFPWTLNLLVLKVHLLAHLSNSFGPLNFKTNLCLPCCNI